MTNDPTANVPTIDLRGLKCPMPIVRLAKLVRECESDALHVVADDPAFLPDVESWCRRAGHALIGVDQSGDECTVTIRCNG